jgi:hypothetical protein
MVEKIEYSHADDGSQPSDGTDFRDGEAVESKGFDWYVSTFVDKINGITSDHTDDSTGVHGLGTSENVLGDTHTSENSIHHERPSETQPSGIYGDVTYEWEFGQLSVSGSKYIPLNVPVKRLEHDEAEWDVDLYIGDTEIGGTYLKNDVQVYENPPFCTKMRVRQEKRGTGYGYVRVYIPRVAPHSHDI